MLFECYCFGWISPTLFSAPGKGAIGPLQLHAVLRRREATER
jgi:hypothetical protein